MGSILWLNFSGFGNLRWFLDRLELCVYAVDVNMKINSSFREV
ncbi:hypothetical protein OAC31_01430 [Polaribacter sp.]|nr:hypothetical protein [Polaribacter sp.]